jgi:hypothetical protein
MLRTIKVCFILMFWTDSIDYFNQEIIFVNKTKTNIKIDFFKINYFRQKDYFMFFFISKMMIVKDKSSYIPLWSSTIRSRLFDKWLIVLATKIINRVRYSVNFFVRNFLEVLLFISVWNIWSTNRVYVEEKKMTSNVIKPVVAMYIESINIRSKL